MAVVFGGVSNSIDTASTAATPGEQHQALNDIVILQAESDVWQAPLIDSSAPRPHARAFHAAASAGRFMYVFGGHVLSFDPTQNRRRRHFFHDLWVLDTDTWQWELLWPGGPNPQDGPSRRDMATLTLVTSGPETSRGGADHTDDPQHLLLFGGRSEAGRALGDAWVFDIQMRTWSLLQAVGPTPPPRKMHAAVCVGNRVLLFGGERDSGVLDDMWTLKGVDGSEPCRWTQIKVRPAPPGRFGHSLAATQDGKLLLFGGCLDTSSFLSLTRSYSQTRELWVLQLASFSWSKVEQLEGPAGEGAVAAAGGPGAVAAGGASSGIPAAMAAGPGERMCHTLTALSGGRLLLVGGRQKEGICKDCWWLTVGSTAAPAPPQPATAAAPLAMKQVPSLQEIPHQPEAAALLQQEQQLQQEEASMTASSASEVARSLAAAAAMPAATASSSSLLQSLLNPLSRAPAQPLPQPPQAIPAAPAAATPAASGAGHAAAPAAAAEPAAPMWAPDGGAFGSPAALATAAGAAAAGHAAVSGAQHPALLYEIHSGPVPKVFIPSMPRGSQAPEARTQPAPAPPQPTAGAGASSSAAGGAAAGGSALSRITDKVSGLLATKKEDRAGDNSPRMLNFLFGSGGRSVSAQALAQQQAAGLQEQQLSVGALDGPNAAMSIDAASALAVQAAADAAALEQLRVHKLGLPAVPHHKTGHSYWQPQQAAAAASPAAAALSGDEVALMQALEAKGAQVLLQQQQQQPHPPPPAAAVAACRMHLTSLPVHGITLSDLELILADYKHQVVKHTRSLGSRVDSQQPGQQHPPASAPALRAMLQVRPFAHLSCVDDLRMSDVPQLVNEYAQLLAPAHAQLPVLHA